MTPNRRLLLGAPRPSQNATNCASAGSDAVCTRIRCAHASATSPVVPGRRARITASPLAASAGVNGGATERANAASAGGGCRVPYAITTSPTWSAWSN